LEAIGGCRREFICETRLGEGGTQLLALHTNGGKRGAYDIAMDRVGIGCGQGLRAWCGVDLRGRVERRFRTQKNSLSWSVRQRFKQVWTPVRKEKSLSSQEPAVKAVGRGSEGQKAVPMVKVGSIGNGWLYRSAVAEFANYRSTEFMFLSFMENSEGRFSVRRMGGKKVLITFPSEMEMSSFIDQHNHQKLYWFDSVTPWSVDSENSFGREIWLSCYGVPVHAWNVSTFCSIGDFLGEVVMIDEDTPNVRDDVQTPSSLSSGDVDNGGENHEQSYESHDETVNDMDREGSLPIVCLDSALRELDDIRMHIDARRAQEPMHDFGHGLYGRGLSQKVGLEEFWPKSTREGLSLTRVALIWRLSLGDVSDRQSRRCAMKEFTCGRRGREARKRGRPRKLKVVEEPTEMAVDRRIPVLARVGKNVGWEGRVSETDACEDRVARFRVLEISMAWFLRSLSVLGCIRVTKSGWTCGG
ncbi:hypothetical protein Dimus_020100, partial [Dionaea muscipula]